METIETICRFIIKTGIVQLIFFWLFCLAALIYAPLFKIGLLIGASGVIFIMIGWGIRILFDL